MYGKAAVRLIGDGAEAKSDYRVLLRREDIKGVDPARVRHRLRLCKHYGAYYGKTRQASTPRGSDADLDYANAMVRATERHNRRRHREGQTQP